MDIYFKLFMASLLSVVLTVVVYLLKKKTKFDKIPYGAQQVIIGILFGILAIIGTENGVPLDGATANARDAAPLCAGLIFGGPAGIIAGAIGGIERWLAASWGAGAYTKAACSISTFLAGVFAAILRKYFFENKRPTWGFGLATGVIMEVIHMTLVFVTNLNDAAKAYEIVKICTIPMTLCNGLSVMLACGIIGIMARKEETLAGERKTISRKIQRGLLATVITAYLLSTSFVYVLSTNSAIAESKDIIKLNIEDTINEIKEISDDSMLSFAESVKYSYEISGLDFEDIIKNYKLDEINIVDGDGIIIKSNDPSVIGFDMNSGKNSSAFEVLNQGQKTLVQESRPSDAYPFSMMKYAGIALNHGGYIQIGYRVIDYQDSLIESINSIIKNRHIKESGYIIVVNKRDIVVSSAKGAAYYPLDYAGIVFDDVEAGETFRTTVFGEKCFLSYGNVEGFKVIGILPEEEAFSSRDQSVYINSYMEVLVFALLFFIIYQLVKNIIVKGIREVNSGLNLITEGKLETEINVRKTTEFNELSDSINKTVDALKGYIEKEKTRIDKELAFAKGIQASALPSVFPAYPNIPEFDIFATMDTAKEVGGDFYDYYMLSDDKFCFLIADVSGKGIPAAMFMMQSKTMIKALAEQGGTVEEILTVANDRLCQENSEGMFVTCWMGILDINTGRIQYVSAGHNPPLIKRKDGEFEYLNSKRGFVLAGMEGFEYMSNEIVLEKGDRMYLYTDGVTEATDINDELYGEDRLKDYLNKNKDKTNEEILHGVKDDIDVFVKGREQFDDITMVGLVYRGANKEKRVYPAKVSELDNVNAFVEESFDKVSDDMKSRVQLLIAVEELFVNVASYAYEGEDGKCEVEIATNENEIAISFIDSGKPFNPLKKKDPDVTLSAEERGIGGLGIYMVKKSMDGVYYDYKDGKNILKIRKVFSK